MSEEARRAFIVYGCVHCKKRIFAESHMLGTQGTCPVCGQTGPIGGDAGSSAALAAIARPRDLDGPEPAGDADEGDSSAVRAAPAERPADPPESGEPVEEPYTSSPEDRPTAPSPTAAMLDSTEVPAELSPLAKSDELTFDAVGVDPRDRRGARRFRVDEGRLELEGGGGPSVRGSVHEAINDISLKGLSFFAVGTHGEETGALVPPDLAIGERITVSLHVPELDYPLTLGGAVARVDRQGADERWLIGVAFVSLDDAAATSLGFLSNLARGERGARPPAPPPPESDVASDDAQSSDIAF